MKPSCLNIPVLFSHSSPAAWSAAEPRGQKGFDQFPCECRVDHFSSQTEYILFLGKPVASRSTNDLVDRAWILKQTNCRFFATAAATFSGLHRFNG